MTRPIPKQILDIEKQLGIHLYEVEKITKFERDTYVLNNQRKVIELNIRVGYQSIDISFLKGLLYLESLTLKENYISDISSLKYLLNLKELILNYNIISDISSLKYLSKLNYLNLANNKISDIEQFSFILDNPQLKITANNNPCFTNYSIELKPFANHYNAISNLLKKQKEQNKNYTLPAKILLLGNTESGKSTLLNYLLQTQEPKEIHEITDSTQILKIETFPKELKANEIPRAVFYDLGGQDYYHGLYQAFLSQRAINIILWNKENDRNQIRKDRTDLWTNDFDRNYYLHQLNYFYQKNKIAEAENEVILLVQSHADVAENNRETYQHKNQQFNIINEFYISLDNSSVQTSLKFQHGLQYLEETIKELIATKKIERLEPLWYEKFLTNILKADSKYATPLSEIEKYYNRENEVDKKYLSDDLRQLAETGLILYYNNDKEINDVAWLNPAATVQDIHENVLSHEKLIMYKGILEKTEFESLSIDEKLVKMLKNQKVIFFDTHEGKYIIPNYLPLNSKEVILYEFMIDEFTETNFILKFVHFIPFGFINQLICFYGRNPDKKGYWRDQLFFTTKDRKYRVLIKLDYTNLEIWVAIKPKDAKDNTDKIQREIFDDILDLYWDKKGSGLTKLKDEIIDEVDNYNALNKYLDVSRKIIGSPKDLFISLDERNFVRHETLNNEKETNTKILSYRLTAERKIDFQHPKEQESSIYKNFTDNKNITAMKKLFISYSHDDLKYREKLEVYLKNLIREGKIEVWHDEMIETGVGWHDTILEKLMSSDIVILMISQSFITSDYIHEVEMRNALKQKFENKSEIIPILLENCDWQHWTILRADDEELKSKDEEAGKMKYYQLIPKNNQNQRLMPVNKWEFQEDAWKQIIDKIRVAAEK